MGTDAFISKWQGISASELSTSQSFLIDLCALLGVDVPHATAAQDYMFERPITFSHGDGSTSAGRIDLYRRGAFVLESKKLKAATHSKGFDDALLRARSQAEAYARALPASEGRPPFVVVVDVGNRIELYAEFSRSGATYTPFPDPRSHRIALADLARPEILDRLRRVWTDPLSLDPSRESARVTREIAARLAELAKSLERAGHAPEQVAQFLMRCLFTMFAEDVRLLPEASFRNLLAQHAERPDTAMRMLAQLWRDMDAGGFSAVLAGDVLRFNGKLFKQPDTLPLDREQVSLLIEAARADWKHVEPAIFGTLLERALSTSERHKLGAHYTPRAYVERLVLPTVIEPLRTEWSDAQAAAMTLAAENRHDEAVAALQRFHHRLCSVRVLDPACGSGNFLYVTLEHLKRLEGEVLNTLDELGFRQTGLALGGERADALGGETVDPHNLLGIELNPRAAAIAEVVLWIGYLQWHFRTRGDVSPPVPVIRDFRNIENRDAVLAYDAVELVTDAAGRPVTRWDGRTMKPSPVTGEPIPDDSARVPLERYLNPRKATWPEADFVVGNPPYIGVRKLKSAIGDEYVAALRVVYPEVPDTSDLVMYWWEKAAAAIADSSATRFGLITTNSVVQEYSRQLLERHIGTSGKVALCMAIPDHPWVDASDGAAVRVALTVGCAAAAVPRLVSLGEAGDDENAPVEFRLVARIGSSLDAHSLHERAVCLRSNSGLCFQGVVPAGDGFKLNGDDVRELGLSPSRSNHLRRYLIGRDLVQRPEERFIIDFFGLSEIEARTVEPVLYQRLLDRVAPERKLNKRAAYRDKWWVFAEPRPAMRRSLNGLKRFICTPYTAKFRPFVFVEAPALPDAMAYAIATDDAYFLGVLSSMSHATWSVASGGTLEDRPRYNSNSTFFPYPFPNATDEQRKRIRELGEGLDAHRKRQQAAHSELTLTGMYNVLEKLRSGDVLSAKERVIHEQGLVSVLRQIHDELDAAVLEAYGWSDLLPLLRVAHGNTSGLPSPPGRRGGDEGALGAESPSSGPAGHLLPGGEGKAPMTRDEAKRAFDEAILERLVALNAERAVEEARGLVRWLRPEFQNSGVGAKPQQVEIDTTAMEDEAPVDGAVAVVGKPQVWPKDAIEQVRAVADLLAASPAPLTVDEIAARFSGRGPWRKRLPQLLDMLVALGRARQAGTGAFHAGVR